ncbi:hypothetical protein C8T65DRAFT_743846 [Cerioporus squamosus]|nr:hypothetical protein C8T65DRAFT_743846 [Cerioporus squamosus]
MEAHQAQNSLGASLPEVQCERFTELQSSELQATALRILDEYEARLREHEEKIRELRTRHIPELKSIYNSGASVNQLPIELLMHIFRAVGPRTSPADAIRLTHVCRSWRSLIHHTPVFWSDFLDSEDGILARTQADYSIVSAAFDRSAPAMQIGFSLNGAFLPLLSAIPAHVSRISKLWLGCTDRNSSAMHPFFGLHIPHLEDLTL